MKKSLIAIAALATVGAASAQSSVTMFGVMDATIAYGSGDVSSKTQLANSGYNSSRLGFRGVEDLGNGLKATFNLEGSVNNDSGTGTATNVNNQPSGGAAAGMNGSQGFTFNRKTVVSLVGNFGEVRLGRDYSAQFWNLTAYEPFGTNGVGSTVVLTGSTGGVTNIRASNTISYLSPNLNGFGVWIQTYFGENASSAAAQAGDGSGVRLTYDKGPLSLGLAFSKTITGVGTDVQTTNFGASYDLGVAQIMALYNKDSNTGLNDVTGYAVGASVPMGPGTVRISYGVSDNGVGSTNKFALGYVYDLSKRTSLYGTYARLNNAGGTSFALNSSVTAVNGSSTGLDLGIKHTF